MPLNFVRLSSPDAPEGVLVNLDAVQWIKYVDETGGLVEFASGKTLRIDASSLRQIESYLFQQQAERGTQPNVRL